MIERQRELLRFLGRHDQWFTGRELATYFSVTDRTIRSDINQVNAQVPGGAIVADKQRGYRAVPDRADAEASLPAEETAGSSRARLLAELYELLRTGSFDVYEIAERLQVSDSTVEGDLQVLRRQLAELGFDRVRIHRHGGDATLLGAEAYSNNLVFELGRVLYTDFTGASVAFLGAQLGVGVEAAVRALDEFLAAQRVSTRFLRSLELVLDHLLLAQRPSQTDADRGDSPVLPRPGVFEDEILDLLTVATGLHLDEPAVAAFRRRLVLRRCLIEETSGEVGSREEIRSFYLAKSDVLTASYQVDLLQDNDLFEALVTHTAFALRRIRLGYKYLNPVKRQILGQYPYVVDAARYVSTELQGRFDILINTDELSYIVVYLAVMLRPRIDERIADLRLRVIVVDMDSRASLKLTGEHIRRQSEGVDVVVVEVHTYLELERALEVPAFVDLIVACGRAIPTTGRPMVHLSSALSEMDKKLLKSAVEEARSRGRRRAFDRFFRPMLRPGYAIRLDVGTSEGAIRTLARLAVTLGLAGDGLYEAVVAREDYLPTSVAGGFALPHALDYDAQQSALLIGFADSPIEWGDHRVDVVILLVSARRDEAALPFVTGLLSDVLLMERTGEASSDLRSLAELDAFLLREFLRL